MFLILGFGLISIAPAAIEYTFAMPLTNLKRQRVQDVGRDALVASYEKFITENARHPKVAQAMLDLAGIYQLHDPANKIQMDPAKSSEWVDRAAMAAPKGSALWLTTQQRLVARYTYSEPNRAAKILDEIAKTFPNHSLTLARVEKARMTVAFSSGRTDDGATHAETLFNWYKDPARIPHDGFAKAELDTLMAGAGCELIQSLRNSGLPSREKKEQLKYWTTHCSWIPHLYTPAKEALESVDDDPGLEPRQ